ncbi:MAG: hypothetical protein J6B53_11305, partial [Clostridia bacterium]|nr:hypothetical protein [Clostridia bacterium]
MMTKRITGCLLTLLLCFGLFGIPVLADPEATPGEATKIDPSQVPQTTEQDLNNQTPQNNANDQDLSGQPLQTDTNGQDQSDQIQQSGNQLQGTGTDQLSLAQVPDISLLSGKMIPILKSGPLPEDKIESMYISNTNDGKLSGTIKISGSTGINLELWQGTTLKKSKALTSSDGNFEFTGLTDGTYELKIKFSGQSTYETDLTKSVTIKNTQTASPITGTAVGGVGQVTATVTSASAQEILVEVLTLDDAVKSSGKISSGIGSITLTGIEKGTYKVRFAYTASTGVTPLVISNVSVTDTSSTIKFTSVVAGEEKLTVSGQAAAGAPVIV